MAESSSLSSLTSLFPVVLPIPEFVELDKKYLCTVCKRVLRAPVQTACGHRTCKSCLDQLFDGIPPDESVKCPGNEESCEDIERDWVRRLLYKHASNKCQCQL